MSVQIEKLSPVKTRLTLTIDAEAVNKEMEKVFRKIRREAAVPGFRPGKAPMSMLKRKFGEYAEQEMKSNLVGESLANAVEENDIHVIGTPELEKDELNEDGSMTVIAVMETRPEVELKEYKGIEITEEKVNVLPAAVEVKLQQKREMTATIEEVTDRDVAEKGDHVRIDFVGKKNGEVFDGGTAKNHTLELGGGQFIPGFEEGVIGMKKGEDKDVEVTFPAEYPHKELAGQPVIFTVTLNAIMRKNLPELDDEFAKDTGEAETLEELKQKIYDEIYKNEEERTKRQAKRQLTEKLIELHALEVPNSLVEQQLDYSVRRYKMEMAMMGFPMPKNSPEAETALRERVREEAKKEVQQAFLVDAIAKVENIDATEEDIEAEIKKIAEAQNRRIEQVSAEYQKENAMGWLREKLREDKVIDFLYNAAKVTMEEPPAPKEHEEEKATDE